MQFNTIIRQSQVRFLLCVAMLLSWGVTASAQQQTDPATVVGHQACVECHKSEVDAWLKSSHALKSHSMLTSNPKAKEFASALGVSNPAAADSVCTDCHGLRQQQADLTVLSGNSCEACHGGSGPKESGWFKIHSDYGGEGVSRDSESEEHYKQRIAECKKLGMNGSRDVYEVAKNCYQCHSVPNEKVVNIGHPTGNARFEFVAWAQGEVRHNFRLDQAHNADSPSLWTKPQFGDARTSQGRKRLMYVVGQLVDLEVSLRNRGKATESGSFAKASGKRIASVQRKLKKIGDIPEVKAALAAAEGADRKRLRKVQDDDAEFFGGLADQVAEQARSFSGSNDGSQLESIDSLLPEDKDAKGAVFSK